MNSTLTRPSTDIEIRKAIEDINLDKAPGPDGMTGLLYQRFWEVTARDVISMVKDFFKQILSTRD